MKNKVSAREDYRVVRRAFNMRNMKLCANASDERATFAKLSYQFPRLSSFCPKDLCVLLQPDKKWIMKKKVSSVKTTVGLSRVQHA